MEQSCMLSWIQLWSFIWSSRAALMDTKSYFRPEGLHRKPSKQIPSFLHHCFQQQFPSTISCVLRLPYSPTLILAFMWLAQVIIFQGAATSLVSPCGWMLFLEPMHVKFYAASYKGMETASRPHIISLPWVRHSTHNGISQACADKIPGTILFIPGPGNQARGGG